MLSSQAWWTCFRRVSCPLLFRWPPASLRSQAQLLSVRLGGSTGSALLSSMQGEGIENFTLHNQSSTNKPDTLPKLVQFSVCMLYSSEPLGQGEERSSKGEDSRAEPHPGLPTVTPRLRYAEGQISS